MVEDVGDGAVAGTYCGEGRERLAEILLSIRSGGGCSVVPVRRYALAVVASSSSADI